MQTDTDPLPVRMLNEYTYCPRLFHLMHVDGRWEGNEFTEDGRAVHGRVDREADVLPEAPATGAANEGDPAPIISRSVMLSSTTLGLIGKPDVVETEGGQAVPVDTKRGYPPSVPGGCYEPERIQLMAQGLLLREHGYTCEQGFLYFASARRRVPVPFTPELESRTRFLLNEVHALMRNPTVPPPLDDSPKCVGCSLAAICLPDETSLLNARGDAATPDVRRLYPARDDALPLYLQEHGTRLSKEGLGVVVTKSGGEKERFHLKDVSQVVLCGNIGATPQTLHMLCESGVSVVHLSTGGWFYGITHGHGLRNAYDRAAQFAVAADSGRCLVFSRAVVTAKGSNQRTLLRRNGGADNAGALNTMAQLIDSIKHQTSLESLLGIEGSIARAYFGDFASMLKKSEFAAVFDKGGRNRRPPKDPLNAMLSYGYALLVKECTVALMAEGLDPWWGLYHQPRHGRPALALDLMEEFRPLIVDSAVLSAVNTGMVTADDFETGVSGCLMKQAGRKALIQAYEQRLDQFMTHPIFEYRCSWRAVVRLQARLLSRWLRGDVPVYEGITTR